MAIKAKAFTAIELIDHGAAIRMVFSTSDTSVEEVIIAVDMFALGLPDLQRIVQASHENQKIHTMGIEKTGYSPIKTIETRTDTTFPRIYLIMDRGQPNEIAYGIGIITAGRLARDIALAVRRWLAKRAGLGQGQ